ncbi:hypothetical protein TCAL_01588 [Tigriopus californicus]|uniref:Uncharacterized protein n=1 Tax=Tigriopus californicus TaxID=6832 RepID=A0A553P8T5_TIGCA|nr:hypothetical protein TCAL_01588 [Tigriopus californicus]
MSRKKKLCEFSFLCSIVFSSFWWRIVQGISCHECGIMYDGTNLMGIKEFDECQFFESDIAQKEESYLKQCPGDDLCCFSLREYMYIDFWGHSAAAEVFLHGCCSALNDTRHHHLKTASPPPLATSTQFRAEILSQTMQDDHIQTRVMFCNTPGCNSKRIPWSQPINMNTMTPAPNLDPKMSSTTEKSQPDTPTTSNPTVTMNGVEYEYEYYYDDYPGFTARKMESDEKRETKQDHSNLGGRIDALQTNDAEVDLNLEPTEDISVIDLLFVEEGRSPSNENRGRPKIQNVKLPPEKVEAAEEIPGFNSDLQILNNSM